MSVGLHCLMNSAGQVNARFMVDMVTYQKMYKQNESTSPEAKGPPPPGYGHQPPGYRGPNPDVSSSKFDKWPVTVGKDESLSEEAMMLLPSTTYGFNMFEKKWGMPPLLGHYGHIRGADM
jgi:hypothetical protein